MPAERKVKERINPAMATLVRKISELQPDPHNARTHGSRNQKAVRDSLIRHGQQKPIVLNTQGKVVIAGNNLMAEASKLGWKNIAAIPYDGDSDALTPDQLSKLEREFGIVDNRSGELATWDYSEMVPQLEDLVVGGLDPEILGWSKGEFDTMVMSDWTPPELREPGQRNERPRIVLTDAQHEAFVRAQTRAAELSERKLSDGEVVEHLALAYLGENE